MNYWVAVLFLLSLVLVGGCSSQPVMYYGRLVDGLRETGATVEPKGNTEQPAFPELFSGTSKAIKFNVENLVVWEYGGEAVAEAETGFISRDGFELMGPSDSKDGSLTVNVGWIAPPHWYQAGRIIVLYVGENQKTLDLLENLLGTQFAGHGPARAAE
ncbi:hypothetical protein ACFLVC_04435 [Chloroflexota bacterium]